MNPLDSFPFTKVSFEIVESFRFLQDFRLGKLGGDLTAPTLTSVTLAARALSNKLNNL
jgi:hypothetical protein